MSLDTLRWQSGLKMASFVIFSEIQKKGGVNVFLGGRGTPSANLK